MANYRALKDSEKKQLEAQNCRATDWSKVAVADPFDAARVRSVSFIGQVRIGSVAGTVKCGHVEEPCGVYDATLADVTLGNGCLVKRVGSRLAGYDLGDGVIVEDVGQVVAEPGATFGCGALVETVNEGGGRGVKLYPELSSNIAHMLSMHRYLPKTIEKIEAMIDARTAKAKASRATIGAGAVVRGVKTMINVAVGPAAQIEGAALLENGTILSEPKAPAIVGTEVIAHEFMIGEGSSVTEGAILAHTFIGQGCKVGKELSAENCVFFANCEAFHSECVAAFAGPYSVTHHRSTLLIAAQFSFYNAGSGTNQSNHMYKLGPLHQGIMERGSKTGSFSYLLWPCKIGPFSVVIGKNMANFDVADLPFSYIDAQGSKSYVTPGFNLYTVGTVRDGAKWPARDRRKSAVKRDLISFPVFSPFTVERMMRGEKLLQKLIETTDKSVEDVNVNGGLVKRLLLKTGAKYYGTGIEGYLAEKLVARAEAAVGKGLKEVQKRLAPEGGAAKDREWLDIGGLLVARDRYQKLVTDVESGAVKDLDALQTRLADCQTAYEADEWNYVAAAWEERYKVKPHEMTGKALAEAADKLVTCRGKAIKMILADAEKEFSDTARIGFGLDGGDDAKKTDFESVRGTYEKNKFVKEMNAELAALTAKMAEFKSKAEALK